MAAAARAALRASACAGLAGAAARYDGRVEIVLVEPEIPHNSGCAARLAAALGLRLHLVEPLGFSLEDRYLKRAGLDYWPAVELVVHADWPRALDALGRDSARPIAERLRLFTARGGRSLFETDFRPDDVLCFGGETGGLPAELLARHPEQRVYVPIRPCVRSLNLANVVALATYTALVRAGVPLPENDGGYAPDARRDEDVRPAAVARRASGAR
jgi:tRNA (cytidine/uridine-2'-O-)-methyltransferase